MLFKIFISVSELCLIDCAFLIDSACLLLVYDKSLWWKSDPRVCVDRKKAEFKFRQICFSLKWKVVEKFEKKKFKNFLLKGSQVNFEVFKLFLTKSCIKKDYLLTKKQGNAKTNSRRKHLKHYDGNLIVRQLFDQYQRFACEVNARFV